MAQTIKRFLPQRVLSPGATPGLPPLEPGGRFLHLYLDLSNQCQCRCVMCGTGGVAGAPTETLSRKVFGELVRKAFPVARRVVLSCAYEPLLAGNFLEALDGAVTAGVPRIVATTNGQALTPGVSKRLVAGGLTDLHVSADGGEKSVYEKIRRGADFGRLLENLAAFDLARQQAGSGLPRLQIQAVVVEENAGGLGEIVERFLPFRPFRFVFVHRDYKKPGPGTIQELERVFARCAEAGALYNEIPAHAVPLEETAAAAGFDGGLKGPEQGPCLDPFAMMIVRPSGDVLACPGVETPMGNLNRQRLSRIWNTPAWKALRRALLRGQPPSECSSCPHPNQGKVRLIRFDEALEKCLFERSPEKEEAKDFQGDSPPGPTNPANEPLKSKP